MKILTKKQVESLFDDIMTLQLMASESVKQQMVNESPSIKDLIRTQRLIIERGANAVLTIRGMLGLMVAKEIHTKYNEARLKDLLKAEANNDTLDSIEQEDKQ